MNRDEFQSLRQRVRQLRKESVLRDGVRIPKSIVVLEEELAREQDRASRYDLYLLIRGECFEARLPDLEIETMRACVRDLPDEPLAWISLAGALRSASNSIAEAKQVAATAVDKAYETDRFVRHALSMQARIATETRDGKLLRDTLTRLIEDAPKRRNEDGPFDIDFMKSLPHNLIAEELAQRYLNVAEEARRSHR